MASIDRTVSTMWSNDLTAIGEDIVEPPALSYRRGRISTIEAQIMMRLTGCCHDMTERMPEREIYEIAAV